MAQRFLVMCVGCSLRRHDGLCYFVEPTRFHIRGTSTNDSAPAPPPTLGRFDMELRETQSARITSVELWVTWSVGITSVEFWETWAGGITSFELWETKTSRITSVKLGLTWAVGVTLVDLCGTSPSGSRQWN
ncbi:hypothetical protein RRG08_038382 [Elysia crispata]|uniref:Uncharacterized protein n=1 Tax=Elysia crispata TaxID=231223 RepID=A0AAE1A7B1_9GAST|nr:hypothetical protein RRG08_038382 [Elysia crispata]